MLTNVGTFSAAEHLTLALQRAGHPVVGERTMGGEAGLYEVQAPDGAGLIFGAYAMTDEDGVGFQGVGIEPDHRVPATLEAMRELGYLRAVLLAQTERVRLALELLGSTTDRDLVPVPLEGATFIPRIPLGKSPPGVVELAPVPRPRLRR